MKLMRRYRTLKKDKGKNIYFNIIAHQIYYCLKRIDNILINMLGEEMKRAFEESLKYDYLLT